MLNLREGSIKRIHVNQHKLRARVKDPECEIDCYTIKDRGQTYTARTVFIHGPSTLVESIDKPLGCGARLWLETQSKVSYTTHEYLTPTPIPDSEK